MGTFCSLALLSCKDDLESVPSPEIYCLGQRLLLHKSAIIMSRVEINNDSVFYFSLKPAPTPLPLP